MQEAFVVIRMIGFDRKTLTVCNAKNQTNDTNVHPFIVIDE